MILETKRELTKKKRREDIIDAAEKVFFSKGIDKTTMEEITNEANLSRRTLYSYFHSKEHLIYEIKIRGFKKLHSLLEGAFNEQIEDSEFQRINNLLMTVLRFQTEYHNYCSVMKKYSNQLMEFQNESSLNEIANCFEIRGIAINYVEKALSSCKEKKLIRDDVDTLDTAIIISGTYSGILNTVLECENTVCCNLKNPKDLVIKATEYIFDSISLNNNH